MRSVKYLIIGGGVASAKAAVAIREIDPKSELVLICGENWNPTDRPPLSKDFLTNPAMKPDDPESKAPEWYVDHHVEVIKGDRVVSLDAESRTIQTESGQSFQYEKLLLATGGSAVRPPRRVSESCPVFSLRSVDDAIAIRDAIAKSKTGICVGSGFIGLEVAASATARGVSMTVISKDIIPWSHLAGSNVGKWIQAECEKNGVTFLMDSPIAEVSCTEAGPSVRTEKGEVITADFVVYGIGAYPNLDLADHAGLEIADGAIKVDVHMKSSDPHIYAAGDCAAIVEPITGESWRTQHYMDAVAQGEAAGANMAGNSVKYDAVAYFFSDVFDIHMAMRGYQRGSSPAGILGQMSSGTFVELFARPNGELAAGLIICADYNHLDPISDRLEPLIRKKVTASSVTEVDLGLPTG